MRPLTDIADRRKLFRTALFLIGAVLALSALALSALALSANAAASHVLIIPSDDGYGYGECLTGKSACGEIVANAWCEANGLDASKSFGRSEDFKSTAGEEGPKDIRPGSFFVTCGDKI
jgi:hypothetical protein